MPIQAVNSYLNSDVQSPFFLVIGDAQYEIVKDKLLELGLTALKVSDYCGSDDTLPDIDALLQQLKTAHVGRKLVVLGLGEYIALRGHQVAINVLSQLKDLNTGASKTVLLLRGVSAQVKELQADLRFDNRRCYVKDWDISSVSITLVSKAVELPASTGIKELLQALENGTSGNLDSSTDISLENSLFAVRKIDNAYDAIHHIADDLRVPRSVGTDDQWTTLLNDLRKYNSLEDVFAQNDFVGALEDNFYWRLIGLEYRNWLYFIALKSKIDTLVNSYLRYVVEHTERFDELKSNVLNAIGKIPREDSRFDDFYRERKALLEKFQDSDMTEFFDKNRLMKADERVYRLTDNTKSERKEIIAWIAEHKKIIPQIAEIYPALDAYLKEYVFNCGDLSSLLTQYFEAYKRQKMLNTLEDEFLEKVDSLAKSREYNQLPTRNGVIDGVTKDGTYLYWLDALGVEYLAFISELARSKGLSVSINIARAELPTITSINRDFFDCWQGSKKEKNDELDNTKHSEASDYNFENNELPIHLAKELDIISEVIDKAATNLGTHKYNSFLIVSDHGASRLAVLRRKEEKYDTDTQGERSGRCCKTFEPYDLPFAVEENGYLVLADYGRFKGSRAANVEVHGGASLEEVIVPIIELKLRDASILVDLADHTVTIDPHKDVEVELSANRPVKNLSVRFNGKQYPAEIADANHYKVKLPIKKAGKYFVDIFVGDNLVATEEINAEGRGGKTNADFDNLF